MGKNTFKVIILVYLLSILVLPHIALAATLNISALPFVQPGENITITGSVRGTSASDANFTANITANISSTIASQTAFTNGTYNFNVTAPNTPGEYVLNITTNSSSLLNKTITVYVSNISTGKIEFLNTFPPFANGSSFLVNISLLNNASLPLANYTPRVDVFQSDGGNLTWTVSNLSAKTNVTGSIVYNITVPTTATPGEYAIAVDKGRIFSVFRVGGNFQAGVNTKTTAGDIRSSFAPNSTVEIVEKLRKSDGTPITGATVSAIITLPNGTTVNVSLSAHPTQDGVYNSSFNTTSTGGGQAGEYKIDVAARSAGTEIKTSSVFNTQVFTGRIEPVKQFFFEWGGQGAFKPGDRVALNIILVNLTDESIINQASCSSSNYALTQNITFVNGTSTTISNSSVTFSSNAFLPGTTVCKAEFSAPNASGTYNMKVNVTVANQSKTIEGFFTVSNFFLDVVPISSLGGEDEFMQVFAPGQNLTLEVVAINTTSNEDLLPLNVTNLRITKVVSLEFSRGSSEVTSLNQSTLNGTNGPPLSDPNITLQLPTSIFGPLLIEVEARINTSGDTVKGTAFVISNYLTGFMNPVGIAVGGMEMGHGGGFNMDTRCAGTVRFQGSVRDAKTGTAAQGASIVGILEAREEETGKDVSSLLSISNSSASDSNGFINASVAFSSTLSSGPHFIVFNASYKGNYAGMPGFFMCRNLNIGFPQIKSAGTTESFSWQISPASNISLSLTNVANTTGALINNTSVVVVDTIFNFNPSAGSMQILKNNTPMQATFNITGTGANPTSNNATILISPTNFKVGDKNLTEWPNGFFDLRPRVISNLGSDTGFGGFMVVAFDAFPEQFSFPQVQAGTLYSTIINVRANLTQTGEGIFIRNSSLNNNTGFTVKIGRPWEGSLTTVTAINATKLSDNWDKTTDFGSERWNVTFLIPSTVKKGEAQLLMTVNGTANNVTYNQVDVFLFMTIVKNTIVIPNEERVGDSSSLMDAYGVKADTHPGLPDPTSTIGRGWNLTWINATYGINSSSGRVCIKDTFNSTRYISGQRVNMPINATNAVKLLVIDRGSAGVYDTVLVNTSNNITMVVNSTLRNFTWPGAIGLNNLYFWTVEECGSFKIVNVSTSALQGQGGGYISSTWGGSNRANVNFSIPYVVISGNTPASGATVNIRAIGKQDNRGFGFESKLTSANYSIATGTTNADGLAFVTLNVTPSGRFIGFWEVTVGSDIDKAEFGSATFFETKGFSTSSQSFIPLSSGLLTLTNDTSNTTGLVGVGINNWIFNGTVTETFDGGFVANGVADTWNVIYNATDSKMIIVNTTLSTANLATAQRSSYNSSSLSLSIYSSEGVVPLSSPALKLGDWNNGTNATNSNYTKQAYFVTDTQGFNSFFVFSGTQNISSLICAQGFEKPTPVPVTNATINVSVTDWSTFPATTKYLDIYKPDGSKASSSSPAVTSPSGCFAATIGPGQLGTWPSSSAGRPPVFIEGTITATSGSSEFVYVGDIFRP